MANEPDKDITAIFLERKQLDEALNAAARDAVLLHKRLGLPMAVWRDGKVVWVSAEDDEVATPRDEG